MSGKALFVVGAVVVSLAGSVVVYRGLRAPEPVRSPSARAVAESRQAESSPNSNSNADVERLRAELGLLQGQLSSLRERVAEQKAPVAPVETEAPEELDPATLQQRREEDAARWKDHMSEVAAAFEQETVDRGFATQAMDALDKAIQSDPVIQAAAGNIDCRSRTCRVEIHDDGGGKIGKQLPLFLHSVGGALPNMQADKVAGENGQSTLVLFMTNEQPVAQVPR
jgi:hypothetical protein